jgi:hypothetical protein
LHFNNPHLVEKEQAMGAFVAVCLTYLLMLSFALVAGLSLSGTLVGLIAMAVVIGMVATYAAASALETRIEPDAYHPDAADEPIPLSRFDPRHYDTVRRRDSGQPDSQTS